MEIFLVYLRIDCQTWFIKTALKIKNPRLSSYKCYVTFNTSLFVITLFVMYSCYRVRIKPFWHLGCVDFILVAGRYKEEKWDEWISKLSSWISFCILYWILSCIWEMFKIQRADEIRSLELPILKLELVSAY